jgi:hypothetical protein
MAFPSRSLRDRHSSNRLRAVATLHELLLELAEKRLCPRFFDGLDGDAVHAGSAGVANDLSPRSLQDVRTVDLVVERVEPPIPIELGCTVELAL